MATKMTPILAALLLASAPAAFAQATGTDQQTTTGAISSRDNPEVLLDQKDVEDRLKDQEFSDLDLELKDGKYRGKADWYGESVDLRVDARTGRVERPDRLSADQVENKLEDEGYDDVGNVRRAGDEYTASAERFGEDVDLRISARSDSVIDPRELKADQVKEKLEDDAEYSDVTVFERKGEYGNFFATGEKDDDEFLIEVNPISGKVESERETS